MKKLRIYIAIVAMGVCAATTTLTAQSTDKNTSTTVTTSSESTDRTASRTGRSQYIWGGIIGLLALGLVGALILRSRKSSDDRPQTGADINNPASGI